MRNDAIPNKLRYTQARPVSGDRLLDRLIDLFNRRPQVVRGEASVVIAALSGHEFIDLSEDFDLEYGARGLFEAPTRLGRLGKRSLHRPSRRDRKGASGLNGADRADHDRAECRTDARP
jgi:hypothetical protein